MPFHTAGRSVCCECFSFFYICVALVFVYVHFVNRMQLSVGTHEIYMPGFLGSPQEKKAATCELRKRMEVHTHTHTRIRIPV